MASISDLCKELVEGAADAVAANIVDLSSLLSH